MTVSNPAKPAFIKATAIILSSTLIASSALPIADANAHDRFSKRHYHENYVEYDDDRYMERKHKKRRYKRKNLRRAKRDLIAAGILGVAIGAILTHQKREVDDRADDWEDPDYYDNAHNKVEKRQLDDVTPYDDEQDESPIQLGDSDLKGGGPAPEVITYNGSIFEPWTVEWYRYCETNYRSFTAKDGTFTGYDGKKHFCVPK